jgi:hypothetical protein
MGIWVKVFAAELQSMSQDQPYVAQGFCTRVQGQASH